MKKCFLLNCLCPVYGVGALLIIYTTRKITNNKLLTCVIGSVVATAIELIFGFFYTELLNAQVWNYSQNILNFSGHISVLYSFFWSILTLILVYVVHPVVKKNILNKKIPRPALIFVIIFVSLDFVFSCFFMKKYKTSKALSISWLINH